MCIRDRVDSEKQDDGELTVLRQSSKEIEQTRAELLRSQELNEQEQARARQILANMEAVVHRAEVIRSDVLELNTEAEELLGGGGEPFLSLAINMPQYTSWRASTEEALAELEANRETLDRDMEIHDQARRENMDALAAADGARERARQRVLQSEERVAALIGDEDDDESQSGLTAGSRQSRYRNSLTSCYV